MELKKINPQTSGDLRVNNYSEPVFVNCPTKVRKYSILEKKGTK